MNIIDKELEEDSATQKILKEIAANGFLLEGNVEISKDQSLPEEGFSANTLYLGVRIGDFMEEELPIKIKE